jgi:hypothetical protein
MVFASLRVMIDASAAGSKIAAEREAFADFFWIVETESA